MSEWFLILLLPVAAWSGWYVALRRESKDARLLQSRNAYFESLTYLLNDQTDQAVDAFLNFSAIDKQTFSNQLALGTLFRKRGELDRALLIHKQLGKIPELEEKQRNTVNFELAEDFLAAGMYLQAQDIFENLISTNLEANQKSQINQSLIRIYERTAQWQKAIDLFSQNNQELGKLNLAHYYCEIAEIFRKNKELSAAKTALSHAIVADGSLIRNYWIAAEIALENGEFISSIHNYQSIAERNAAFLPEIIQPMLACYQKIEREAEFFDWIFRQEEQHQNIRLTLALSDILEQNSRSHEAQDLIFNRTKTSNNPLLLNKFLQYQSDLPQNALIISLTKKIRPRTSYQCCECGFLLQKMIWHCPACYAWSSFIPTLEIKVQHR
ncbi:MAG: lipopolysaccharide assembly protein LapB [Cardiobacteriaceae bacterium]|nr:lipopolysaccharide assembly protein LapB [Cardiobacteriaceae bacterium]